MVSRVAIVFALSLFLFTTGCLDALTNSSDSSKFWGEDCEEVSEEICPSGEAPDFSLVDQNGNPVNLTLYEDKIVVVSFLYTTCPDICPALTYQLRKLSEGVHVVVGTPGSGFGTAGEGYFRLSAFNSRENVEEAMQRIISF